MLERWREGYDIVYGVRKNRKENIFSRIAYAAFYRLLYFLSSGGVPRDSGDFCLMDRMVAKTITDLPERLIFLRGMRAWVGFKQVAHEYDRPARAFGETKYTLLKLYALATDGIAASSTRPLKVAQFFSIVFFILGVVVPTATLLVFVILGNFSPETLWIFTLFCMIGFLGFAVLVCLWIMSAYLSRMYLEVKGRPPYVLMEVITPSNDQTGG